MTDTATVTILFTDVVGSVELRTTRGDESAHQIMETHFDLVRRQIEQCSGQEIKTIGDSFMVAFSSARSAVNCAVAVQQALAKHNQSDPGQQVHIRIGMNTGEAIEKEGDLFGSAVDAASRVMSKAAGGQILIPENTRAAIGAGEDVALLDRGPFWLKGFPERWRLYEVLWHEDKVSTAAAMPHIGHRTPFVGREGERADLRRFLDGARSGQGALVMIGGEPGVGKTRITEELVAEARRHGFLTLTGHCYEMEGAPPYIPFIEILQSIIRMVEPNTLLDALGNAAPEAAKLVPELRERFPDLPEPRKLPPEQERLYLFNNLRDFFERMGSRRPLLLVIEDLHWTDEPTLLLLQHLVQRLNEMPVLVVGTYRDTELDVARSLAKALEELLRQSLAHDMLLKRLSEDGVLAMLRGRSGQEPPSRLVETIHNETEGNPFFVEEVFKHLAEEGKLFDSEGQWRSDLRIEETDVPRGVLLVIGHRLERVSEGCRRILARAAVIGRGVSFRLLNEVIELDEDALFDAIEEAERAQLIRSTTRGGEARLMFSHELIRQTLLSDLSTPRRQRLHLRVAAAIERLHAEALEEHAADLAYHFYQGGGDPEKTIEYAVLAAERATAQTAYEEAVAQYRRALQALEQQRPVDEYKHCDLLTALGLAYGNAGAPPEAIEVFLRVTEIARKLPAPEQFAEATLGLGRFLYMAAAVDDQLISLMDEALTVLPEEDSALRASLMGRLSQILELAGDSRSITLSEQAISIARRIGDPEALYYALWSRVFVWDRPLEERVSDANEFAKLEEETGSPVGGDEGLSLLCHLHCVQGDIAASDADLAALKIRAAKTSHPSTILYVKFIETTRALMTGRFEEAERLRLETFSVGQKVNEVNTAQISDHVIFVSAWQQGRLDDRASVTRAAIDLNPQFRERAVYRASRAYFLLMLGLQDRAREEFERLAANDFRALPRHWSMPLALMYLSEVAFALGDTGRAAQLYDLLFPIADRLILAGINGVCSGAASHWLGMLAGTLKRWDDAVSHFENAIETNARIGARPYLARSQHEYARMLIERSTSDDKEKARTLLTDATATYRELGMPTFLEDAEGLLESI